MRPAAGPLARIGTAAGLAWRAHPAALLGYAAASLAAGIVPVAAAWLSKLALDRAPGDPAAAWTFGLALAGVGLGVAALPPLLRFLQGELGRAVCVRAKDELYRTVTAIPLLGTLEVPEFRDRLRLAEQASRSGPGEVVSAAVGLVQAGVTVAGLLVAIALIDPLVAGVLLLSALPALAAEVRLSRQRAEMLWRISPAERREVFYTDLLTSLAAAKETRLFGTGPLFRRRMLGELSVSNAEQRRFERREAGVQVGLSAVAAVLAGIALVRVLLAAARGTAGPGDVTAVVVAVAGLQTALAAAVQHVATGHYAGLLLDHFRALTVPPAPGPSTRDRTPSRSGGRGIELDDVWFRYGDDQPWALRGVSLTVPDGHALALVGENGSGKSTLVKLLCRFYDPTRGSIRWDGVDLRDLPLDALRQRIGAVFQDFMAYDLTAAENVALGDADGRDRLDLAPDRIVAAARAAEVHEVVERLPGGYRTMLSRTYVDAAGDEGGGVLLSGGQWQRLALARALLRGRRDLLVLDEPSSGLDAEAEHRIHERIREHRRGRTSVLVSHRLNTVRDADRIVVLAAGEIAEEGDHATLLAAGGTYARLFRLQAAGYETAPAP